MTQTVVELFEEQVHRSSVRPALRFFRDERWETISWKEWWDRSERVAAGLLGTGLAPGGVVALIMSTRMEWALVDMGIGMSRGICLTLDPAMDPAEVAGALADHEVETAVVEGPVEVAALLAHQEMLPALQRVVVVEQDVLVKTGGAGRTLFRLSGLQLPPTWELLTLDELQARGRAALATDSRVVARQRRQLRDGEAATVMYTSGVTGPARGVQLSHRNLATQLQSLAALQLFSSDDSQLLFLPLSNMFGRVLYLAAVGYGMTTVFGRGREHLIEDLQETGPTLIASIPRVYEDLRRDLEERIQRRGLRARLLPLALKVGSAVSRRVQGDDPVGLVLSAEHRLFSHLLLEDMRQRLGGNTRFLISAGAPLAEETARFFFATGLLLLEGYGLTETSGAVTFNLPDDFRFGSVGKALPRIEVAISETGEVLVRGDTVTMGYEPSEQEGASSEGWFHTGDRGRFDREGFLYLDGRVEDEKIDLRR